jgi:predicted nucleic acid-binding protein
VKVYLDTSVLKRPFDDQTQPRIALETQAVVTILAMMQSGEIAVIGSAVLRYENSRNPDLERRRYVDQVFGLCEVNQVLNDQIQSRAAKLAEAGVKPLDALHLASAEAAAADYFVTCDDRLPRRYAGPVPILNPVGFVLKLSEQT